MDGLGRCIDNIFVERLWRSLKYEYVYLHVRKTGSMARAAIGRWLTVYNHRRPHTIRREIGPLDQFPILLKHGSQTPAVVYIKSIQNDQQVQG